MEADRHFTYAVVGSHSAAKVCEALVKENRKDVAYFSSKLSGLPLDCYDSNSIQRLNRETEERDDSAVVEAEKPYDISWCEENGIHIFSNNVVKSVSILSKHISLEDGSKYTYKHLLFVPESEDITFQEIGVVCEEGIKNIYSLQTLQEMQALRNVLKGSNMDYTHIVIAGDSSYGLEIASNLSSWNPASISVIMKKEGLLSDVLCPKISGWLEMAFQKRNIRFVFGETIVENQGKKGLKLSNGDWLPCDILIPAFGRKANLNLITESTKLSKVDQDVSDIVLDYEEGKEYTTDAIAFILGTAGAFPPNMRLNDNNMVGIFTEDISTSVSRALWHIDGRDKNDTQIIDDTDHTHGRYFGTTKSPIELNVFGRTSTDGLKMYYGRDSKEFVPNLADSSEPSDREAFGAYYFQQSDDENNFHYVIGAVIVNGTQEDIQCMKNLAAKSPLIKLHPDETLGIEFARDVGNDILNMELPNQGEKPECLNGLSAISDTTTDQEILIEFDGRLIDVIASLKHVFRQHAHTFEPEMLIEKCKLRQVTSRLDLHLTDEEFAEALCAFPEKNISYQQFATWWIS